MAGCGGTTSGTGTGASDLVPASAPVFVAIDTDPQSAQWKAVDDLASRFPDKQKGVDSLKRDLLKDDGIDWDKDVKPALGKEIDFVWLDFEDDGENFILLTQPKDEAKFKQLIAKGNKKDPADKIYYEAFRDWYVLAPKPALIDRFKEDSESTSKKLAEDSAFKRSMNRLGGDAIVRAYVNGRAVMDAARRFGGPDLSPYIAKAGTLDWIASRVTANSDGIGLDAIVHGTPGKLFSGISRAQAFDAKLPKAVPQDALIYWTFHGTKNLLSGLEQNSLFNTPELRPYRRAVRQLGTLLRGENALYVRPGAGRAPGIPFKIPEVTFVAAPGKGVDPAGVLDDLLVDELEIIPDFTTIAGTSVRKLGDDELAGYYADVDGKLVITDLPAGVRGVKNPGTSLAQSDRYRTTADSSGLPDKTHGFVYVDLHSTIPLVERLSETRVPADIRRNLKPLQSAIEYVVARSHELQLTLFVGIK